VNACGLNSATGGERRLTTTTQVEVKAGPLGDLSEVPTEELERQLAELRTELNLGEIPEKTG
jgi:hypothetical protein